MVQFMKNLIMKIGLFLKKLTGKKFTLLRDNASLAITVTDKLKSFVESKTAANIVNLIPGNLDNALLVLLQKVLPGVSQKLALAFKAIQDNKKNSDAVTAIIARLQEIEPDLRGSFYLAFSAELNKALADEELSLAESAALVQMLYLEIKEAKK
jgi:hypothetical protein